jgi:DNA polymerase-3 subunit chi
VTSIRFYSNATNRLQTAAAWLAGAWREHKSIVVFAPERDVADQLDRLLWTQAATSFLPHCRVDSPLADETPILITDDPERTPQDQCLVNLSNEIPAGFARFDCVIEIISTDDPVRLPGRDRYRFYRERGYALENCNIADGF